MEYQQLITDLKSFGSIIEDDEKKIKAAFQIKHYKRNEVIIDAHSGCDKMFYVNIGLLRAYSIDAENKVCTRRIAWERGFLTNMDSFRRNGKKNFEIIECLEDCELLQITRANLDLLLKSSANFRLIYILLLEKYIGINIRRYQHLSNSTPIQRLLYFRNNYHAVKNRISDIVLASYIGVSTKTLQRSKYEIINKTS